MPAYADPPDLFDVDVMAAGGWRGFRTKIALHGVERPAEKFSGVGRVDKMALPAEAPEREAELGQRAAIGGLVRRGFGRPAHQRKTTKKTARHWPEAGRPRHGRLRGGAALIEDRDGGLSGFD